MAKKVVALEVTLTAGQAAAELDKLNKAASDTANNVDKVDEGFKTLKQQLKEAQNEAQLMSQKFGDTSKQAVEAQKKVARLKDEVGDFNARVEALNPEAKFKAFGQVAQGIASGFAAAQGAAALFGAESEDVQKALLKLQAAMAIAQGVEGLMGLADSFKTMKVVAVDAMNGIKTAILSNPLFAIVGLVTAAVAAFQLLGQEVDKESEKIKANGEAVTKLFNDYEAGLDKEIRLKRAAGEETVDLERKKLQAVFLRTQKELETEIKLLEQKRKLAKAAADQEVNLWDYVSGNIATKEYARQEGRKILEQKTNDEIEAKKKALSDADIALQEFNIATEKKANDTKLKNYNDYLDKKKKQSEEDQKIIDEALQGEDKWREEMNNKRDENLKIMGSFASSFVQKTEPVLKTLAVPVQKFTEESLTALEIFNAKLKQSADNISKELDGNFGKSQEFALQTVSANLETASKFMDAAMNRQLNKAKGNEAAQEKIRKTYFERQKKMQIAQALISTYESAVNSFNAISKSPITPLFPAAPYIAAATAIASGLAQVAAIRSTSYEGGGSGGGAGGSQTIPNLAAPEGGASNTVGSTELNRQAIEQGNQVVIQNNISETEITSTQNRVNRIQARATID